MGIFPCAVAVGIPSSGREATGGPDIPESISTPKFHFVPRASTVSRRLHCSPGGFLRTYLHSSKPCFVPTRCSSDEASRSHQQPLIHLFVSLAVRTSWSGINANTDSPNMHKCDTCGVPSEYWNGVAPSGRTVNLESTNPAYRTANGMDGEIAESCMLLMTKRECECLSVCVHVFRQLNLEPTRALVSLCQDCDSD